jgi:hypothetical protein
MPCRHAISAIYVRRHDHPQDHVSEFLKSRDNNLPSTRAAWVDQNKWSRHRASNFYYAARKEKEEKKTRSYQGYT